MTIRKANGGDAKRLAAIAEETFRDTFAPTNTAEDMELHCRTNYSEAIQAEEIADPDTVTLLFEQDGALKGFAQLRWGEPPACVDADAPGEIHRLYVVRDGHGRGVAHEIIRACLDELGRRGSDVVWLGVWERNHRAISFYKKFDFREVGEHVFSVGNDPQRDIVLARPVTHAPSSRG